jgi:hypothetical protein
MFARMRSAIVIAFAIADSDAGDGLPSHSLSFQAARMLARYEQNPFVPLVHGAKYNTFVFCSP